MSIICAKRLDFVCYCNYMKFNAIPAKQKSISIHFDEILIVLFRLNPVMPSDAAQTSLKLMDSVWRMETSTVKRFLLKNYKSHTIPHTQNLIQSN